MSFLADGFSLIQDIDVRLTVELGRKQIALRDVLALGESSVIELDRLTDDPLDIMVNGKLIARGEVVAQGNRFAIRVLELVGASGNGAGNGGGEGSQDRRAAPITVSNTSGSVAA